MSLTVYVQVLIPRPAPAQRIGQPLEPRRNHCLAYGWAWRDDSSFRDDEHSGVNLNRPRLDRRREAVWGVAADQVLVMVPATPRWALRLGSCLSVPAAMDNRQRVPAGGSTEPLLPAEAGELP